MQMQGTRPCQSSMTGRPCGPDDCGSARTSSCFLVSLSSVTLEDMKADTESRNAVYLSEERVSVAEAEVVGEGDKDGTLVRSLRTRFVETLVTRSRLVSACASDGARFQFQASGITRTVLVATPGHPRTELLRLASPFTRLSVVALLVSRRIVRSSVCVSGLGHFIA